MSGLSKNILIIGATSAIAKETARLYAQEKARLLLVGRDKTKLEHLKEDLYIHCCCLCSGQRHRFSTLLL